MPEYPETLRLAFKHDWDRFRQLIAGELTEVEPRPVPWLTTIAVIVEGGNKDRIRESLRSRLLASLYGSLLQADDDDVAVVVAVYVGNPVPAPLLRRGEKT